MFSCEFCEISKNTFFTEHLWAAASVVSMHEKMIWNEFHKKRVIQEIFSSTQKWMTRHGSWRNFLSSFCNVLLICLRFDFNRYFLQK